MDTYVQNLIIQGKTLEQILQILKICYKELTKEVAVANTFNIINDEEDF